MIKAPPRLFAACLALTFALAVPAAVQSAPAGQTQTPPAENAAASSLDEVVCQVRETPVTGTRITRKRKICRTRREWLEETRIAQDTLNRIQENARTQNGIVFKDKKGGT